MSQKGKRQTMPAAGADGWQRRMVGKRIEMMFHPNRSLDGGEPNVLRPTIVLGVRGSGDRRPQLVRIDPFSEGPHYHIRPAGPNGGKAFAIPVPEGENALEVSLARFFTYAALRRLVRRSGAPKIAQRINRQQVADAVRWIRKTNVACAQ